MAEYKTTNPVMEKTGASQALPAQSWFLHGLCKEHDPDELFVDGQREQRQARKMCFDCPVRLECLADALDNEIPWGIWGGMTKSERQALLRENPRVTDWFPILQRIQDDLDSQRAAARMNLVDLWRAKFEREERSYKN